MVASIVVLHVDDDQAFADTTAALLERADDRLEVLTENSVADGLDRLADTRVDCIVSDYDMPGRDGLDFLEAVRADDRDIPFILYTGKGSEEVAAAAFSRDATDYLQKRAGSDQATVLANRLVNYVETARANAERRRRLTAIETAKEGISILDADGEFVFVNEAYAALYGYDPDEMVGESWDFVRSERERERMLDEVVPTFHEEGEWHGKTIGRRADGSTFVEDHSMSLTAKGEIVCSVRDASQYAAPKRYGDVFEAMGDAVYALDADGRLIQANENVAEFLGADLDALRGEPIADYFVDDLATIRDAIQHLIDTDEPTTTVETTVERDDGSTLPVEVTLSLLPSEDGEFRGTVGVARDVRDRRERARERERLETMVEAMGDGVYVLGPEARVQEINGPLLEMLGYAREDIVGTPATTYFDEDGVERFEAEIRRLVSDPSGGVSTVEATLQHADGDETPVEVSLTVLQHDGEFRGTVGVVRDVTERRERERELEQFETLLGLMPDTVVVTDLEGRVTDLHGFVDWSGYDYDDLVGEHVSIATTDDAVTRASETTKRLLESDGPEKDTFQLDVVTADGDVLPHESHVTLLPPGEDGEIPGTMSVLRNIADRVEREEELERQNERLEDFAGIVSHDLRNPLNVATGRLELAREECESEHLAAVDRSLDRMTDLIEELLALARERDDVTDPDSVSLTEAVEAVRQTVDTGDATLAVAVSGRVVADESRLKQLLENLIRNAVDHGGADVTIRIGDLPNGFYVADDGPGIPASDRDQVFESGYSTDPQGTGFGLSIVREVADAHGWSVAVTASDDGGARFEVTWPADE